MFKVSQLVSGKARIQPVNQSINKSPNAGCVSTVYQAIPVIEEERMDGIPVLLFRRTADV